MKGLQHKVIEINDTNNAEIEKILIFLTPGEKQINVANTRAQAQELLTQMNISKKPTKKRFSKSKFSFNFNNFTFKNICIITAISLILAVGLVVLLI